MIEMTPTLAMTDTELEAWFAEAGLAATVVHRCPAPQCRVCAGTDTGQLANAA
jgi:hypothetical protein